MPMGGTLVAYTDGLVERRGEDLDAGMRRLLEAVLPLAARPIRSFVDDLLVAMRDEATTDDIAVLALRRVST
jgi:serine phosphatase RsbU (regulator of sigma subunit)